MSPLGFGVSGPHATPLAPPQLTQALIEQAYSLGVRLFDTAPFYGPGAQAERRLAEALTRLPGPAVLSTKMGTRRHWGRRLVKDFTPEGVAAQARASQGRLCPHRPIDIGFLHGPHPAALTPALREALAALQGEGVVAAWGVAGRGAELHAALDDPLFTWLMCPLGSAYRPLLHRAAEQGVGVIGIETLRPARPRLRLPRRPADLWATAKALRDMTRPAGEAGPGIAAALTLPAVRSVLVTTTNPAHLAANAAAAGLDPNAMPT